MKKVIISTVGTSLLTNQVNNKNEREFDWRKILNQNANLKESEIDNNTVKTIIKTLKDRASNNLKNADIKSIRRSSAELNGMYGVYQQNIQLAKEDIHYLITTDTYQGVLAGNIIKNFLNKKNIYNVNIKTPPGLSTASTKDFTQGINDLIYWFRKDIKPWKESGYKIILNLVGSFKSLQGYLNTIGMFYADEIIYIFEGKGAELIAIPRLPINIDIAKIEPYKLQLALIEVDELKKNEITDIPETLITEIDGTLILSDWGNLIWEECKEQLLSKELLLFDNLEYTDTFRGEYNNIKNDKQRTQLQLTLAKVSSLLKKSNGDTSILKNTINYKSYEKPLENGVDRIRIGDFRISCQHTKNALILRHYGTKAYVQRKELR